MGPEGVNSLVGGNTVEKFNPFFLWAKDIIAREVVMCLGAPGRGEHAWDKM